MSFQLDTPETAKGSHKRSAGTKRRPSTPTSELQGIFKHIKRTSSGIFFEDRHSDRITDDTYTSFGLPTDHTEILTSDHDPESVQPQYLEFHRVDCVDHEGHGQAIYSDRPRLFKNDSRVTQLHGRHHVVQNIMSDEFAAEHPLVSFIVVKDYDCGSYYEEKIASNAFQTVDMPKNIAKALAKFKGQLTFLKEDGPEAVHTTERVYPISQELKTGIARLEKLYPQYESNDEDELQSLMSPYLGIYHLRKNLHEGLLDTFHDLSENQIVHVKLLVDYILTSHAQEYHEADHEFVNFLVTKSHFSKLYALQEIIVQQTNEGPIGLVISKILRNTAQRIDLECWGWEFDGQFHKQNRPVTISWPSEDDEVSLTDLGVFPLRTANKDLRELLEMRGQQFWKCRKRRLMEYDSLSTTFEFQTVSCLLKKVVFS